MLKVCTSIILIGMFIFLSRIGVGDTVRSGIVFLSSPLMYVATAIKSNVGWESVQISEDTVKELIRENQELSAARFEAELLHKENQELRDALQFKKETGIDILPVNVLLFTSELGREFLLVNGGKELDIKISDVVLTSDRIMIGNVSEVGDGFSKIEIASNPLFTHEVRIIPGDVNAVAKGLGGRTFSLELIPQDAVIKIGDFVAVQIPTATASVLVAKITKESVSSGSLFKEVYAVLIAKPEFLETVFILRSK